MKFFFIISGPDCSEHSGSTLLELLCPNLKSLFYRLFAEHWSVCGNILYGYEAWNLYINSYDHVHYVTG